MINNPPANAGDAGLIFGSGRFPGVRNGNPLQHSCLENFTDKEAWRATVHGVTRSQRQLSLHTTQAIFIYCNGKEKAELRSTISGEELR